MAEEKAVVKIAGKEYELTLTTLAVEALLDKLGCDLNTISNGLENVLKNNNPITFIAWIITLLANQTILIKNEKEGTNEPLLTEEKVKLLTTPDELVGLEKVFLKAINNGLSKTIVSEEAPKNT